MTTETTDQTTLNVTITMADEPYANELDTHHALFDYVLTCPRCGEIDGLSGDEAEAERDAWAHIDEGHFGWDRGDVIWNV